MLIDNPFQLNDWPIKKFLVFVYSILLLMLFLVIVGTVYDEITILRQIVGFFYLSLIPGFIILRTLRIHDFHPVKTLLFAVAISLIFNMLLGLVVNLLYPLLGISKPLSSISLIITWSIVLIPFTLLAYFVDKEYSSAPNFDIRVLFQPQVLFLIMLPVLSFLGAQLINCYNSDLLIIVLLLLIAFVPILALIFRFIPESLYSLALFCIALALLWHFALISKYLVQFDLLLEYQMFNNTNVNGIWDWTMPHEYNAMLSITILPAVFSKLSNTGGTEIFKIIYPIWYALVPLGVYKISQYQFDSRISFLATFFFMSIQIFFLTMPSIARQMVAELFYLLLFIIILEKDGSISKKGLFIILAVGLVISHYSLAYLFIGFMVLSTIILYILRRKNSFITMQLSVLAAVICISWYIYVSESLPFVALTHIGQRIVEGIVSNLMTFSERDIAYIVTGTSPDLLHLTYRFLWYIMLIFMAVGAVKLLPMIKRESDDVEYAALAFCNYILLGACIVIPFFSSTLGINRMIHISSLIVAPFCILGAEILFVIIRPKRFKRFLQSYSVLWRGSIPVITLLMVIFFIFTSSLPFELANSTTGRSRVFLATHITEDNANIELDDIIHFRMSGPSDEEVYSALWLNDYRNKELAVYGTPWQLGIPSLVSYGMIPDEDINILVPKTDEHDIYNSYIYMGYVNTVLGYGTTRSIGAKPDPVLGNVKYWELSTISELMEFPSKIYSNNVSEIFFSTEH